MSMAPKDENTDETDKWEQRKNPDSGTDGDSGKSRPANEAP